MSEPDFWDFMMEGGDKLLNAQERPYCGGVIYLDQGIEWVEGERRIAKCSNCGEEVKIT